MKYIIRVFLYQLILVSFMHPQELKRDFFTISFGGSDFHIKDQRASPLIFSSFGIAPSLNYLYRGTSVRHFFEASYFNNDLTTITDNYRTDNENARIRYSFVYSITGFNIFKTDLKLYLGGSAASYLCHCEYYFNWNPSGYARAMESWYWSNSIDLSAQLEYERSSREFFYLQLFVPLYSNVSRPQYSPTADYNYYDNDWKFKMFGESEFFPSNLSINSILTYQRELFWNFNLCINYEFYYSFYKSPKEINLYMNNFRAGLTYCF
jgi:hypothetical protein